MIPFRTIQHKTLQKGSLISFNYLYYKHDPSPLVLVTSIYGDGKIAGINLHYLTYRYVRNLVNKFCDNRAFGYPLIKGDQFLYRSFRTYKRSGVTNLHMLDCSVINQALTKTMKSFQPHELEAMKRDIQQQLNQIQNPNAADLANSTQTKMTPFQHNMFQMDGRTSPNLQPPGPPPPMFPG